MVGYFWGIGGLYNHSPAGLPAMATGAARVIAESRWLLRFHFEDEVDGIAVGLFDCFTSPPFHYPAQPLTTQPRGTSAVLLSLYGFWPSFTLAPAFSTFAFSPGQPINSRENRRRESPTQG